MVVSCYDVDVPRSLESGVDQTLVPSQQRQIHRDRLFGGQGSLRHGGGFSETPKGLGMRQQFFGALLVPRRYCVLIYNPVNDDLVEIVTPQVGVATRRDHLNKTASHLLHQTTKME